MDPTSMSPGSIMPPYPWLFDNDIDYSTLPRKIRVLQGLGTPYPAGFDQQAVADARQQADGIVRELKKENLDVKSDKEIVALIAYLQRLGTDRVDILLLHDCDRRNHGDAYRERFGEAMNGAYRALLSLREQGAVRAIGAGLNEWEACQDFAEAGDFDCFLLAGRYTLLDQSSLDSFLPLCEQRGIGIILGGPYNSGILATGPVPGARYDYAPASPAILERTGAIEAACRRHGVPLRAAALQFPLQHPAVASVIPGARDAAEVEENLRLITLSIPYALWLELRQAGLIR
jgi:D-threo-aldose 1-dehydrogenase